MSRPVDVLAVMRDLRELADAVSEGRPEEDQQIAEADAAIAAVAGLVQEVRDLLYSHPAAQTYPDGPCIERQQRAALVAALARIGGAP